MRSKVRRNFQIIVISILILFVVYILFLIQFKKDHYNLIIISIDTLRADHMGVYGYNKNTTPNIDNWSKNSFIFTNAYTSVPVTVPSFLSFFSGLDPHSTQVVQNVNSAKRVREVTMLPEVLHNHGYTTSAFVSSMPSFNHGYDAFDFNLFKYVYKEHGNDKFSQNSRENYEQLITNAQQWLSNNKEKKYFMWLHLMDPHAPYFPPKEYQCKFNKNLCPAILDKTLEEIEQKRFELQGCHLSRIPENDIQYFTELYDNGISYSDYLVSKILDTISKLHLDKNTIVVLYGDHGEGFDHNYYFTHKDVLYNSAIHIPFIVKIPNKKGIKLDTLIQNSDFVPTILPIMGIQNEKVTYDGTNIFTPRFETTEKRKYTIAMNSTLTKFSIFDGNYKYILSFSNTCLLNGLQEEFYNLNHDPEEQNPLPIENIQAQKLKKELLSYIQRNNIYKNSTHYSNNEAYDDAINNLKSLEY